MEPRCDKGNRAPHLLPRPIGCRLLTPRAVGGLGVRGGVLHFGPQPVVAVRPVLLGGDLHGSLYSADKQTLQVPRPVTRSDKRHNFEVHLRENVILR